MHSAVLQNKKYIKFADDNTVEVLALGRLDEGIQKGDQKAETYKKRGSDTEYMVKWPNLTAEQIAKLRRSPAGQYNKTGKIPYTAIVDPHTLKEVQQFPGTMSAKSLMEAVTETRRELVKEHGQGIDRDTIRRIAHTEEKARELTADGDYAKAVRAVDKVAKKAQDWPTQLQERIGKAREAVVAAARARFEEIKQLDPKEAKRALSRFMRKAKGTGLVEEARAHLQSLSSD